MSDKNDQDPRPATDTSRRRFLAGAAALGVGAATLNAFAGSESACPPNDLPLTGSELDKQLHEQVKTIVVIYAENQTDSAVSLEELQAKIGQVIAQNGDTQVYIRADSEAGYGSVVKAMAVLQQGGVTNLGLVTEAPQ